MDGAPISRQVGIYQPFYKPELAERLDDGFIRLHWLSNPAPALRELALHRHIASRKIFSNHRLTGLVSPKFFAKTNLSSFQVYDWIAQNPGHDLYLINGTPFVPYTNFNYVERNNLIFSPEFESRMRSVCGRIGLPLPERFPRQANGLFCNCNYWAGSADFWENWTRDVLNPVSDLIEHHDEDDPVFQHCVYPGQTPVYELVMIYERMIDFYVKWKKIDALYYQWTPERILALEYHPAIRAYLREMVPRVDEIDARGQWDMEQRLWLRKTYASVRLRWSAIETLSADTVDFDLPRRFPPRGAVRSRMIR